MARGSYYFNRSQSAHITFAGSADFAIATSATPFTVEAWLFPQTTDGTIFSEQYTGSGNTISLVVRLCDGTSVQNNGLYLGFGWYNGSAWTTAAVATDQLTLLTWSHVACVFTGSTCQVYINGTDRTKTTSPVPATAWGITGVNGDLWYIGRRWDTGSGGTYYSGFIHDFRFVNGSAVYTANFTPTTSSLTNIVNTKILTCNNYEPVVQDSGPNAVVLTNVNSVTTNIMTPDRAGFIGEAVIASDEFNSAVADDNRKGRWSSVTVGPRY